MATSKKILVTGGSGFIGQHLIDSLLKKKCQVAVLDRTPKIPPTKVKIFRGDIRNRMFVKKAIKGIDLVYHLAGVLGTEELNIRSIEATEINVIGTLNVLEEALLNKTKVLFVSKPNIWLNTYSITKEAGEKFCLMFHKIFGLKTVIVKWFNVYGPDQKHYGVQKAVPTFIVKALKNEPLPIFGNGNQMADFIYVTDTATLTIKAAEAKKMEGQIVEIGSGKGTKVIDLARMIIKLTKSKSKLKFLPMRDGENPNAKIIANTMMLKKLKFKPKVGLKEGLLKTIAFYKKLL